MLVRRAGSKSSVSSAPDTPFHFDALEARAMALEVEVVGCRELRAPPATSLMGMTFSHIHPYVQLALTSPPREAEPVADADVGAGDGVETSGAEAAVNPPETPARIKRKRNPLEKAVVTKHVKDHDNSPVYGERFVFPLDEEASLRVRVFDHSSLSSKHTVLGVADVPLARIVRDIQRQQGNSGLEWLSTWFWLGPETQAMGRVYLNFRVLPWAKLLEQRRRSQRSNKPPAPLPQAQRPAGVASQKDCGTARPAMPTPSTTITTCPTGSTRWCWARR